MADERKYYCYCDNNCKYETMSKEQILAAIVQAVSTGEIRDIDSGFITTVKTVNNRSVKFFFGTEAEYNALGEDVRANLIPYKTDDSVIASILRLIEMLEPYSILFKGDTGAWENYRIRLNAEGNSIMVRNSKGESRCYTDDSSDTTACVNKKYMLNKLKPYAEKVKSTDWENIIVSPISDTHATANLTLATGVYEGELKIKAVVEPVSGYGFFTTNHFTFIASNDKIYSAIASITAFAEIYFAYNQSTSTVGIYAPKGLDRAIVNQLRVRKIRDL